MINKIDLAEKLLAVIKEAESGGADTAIYLAQFMKSQAAQIEIRNTRVSTTVERVEPVLH